jgi:hypothetical protein
MTLPKKKPTREYFVGFFPFIATIRLQLNYFMQMINDGCFAN